MQAQSSITTTSSATSTDNHSKDKVLKKICNNEGNRQEKSAKAAEKTLGTISTKRSEESINKKSGQKKKKADSPKKEQIMKTEATQVELIKETNAKEAIKSPAVFSYKVSPVLKSPVESERAENVQKTLALLAAAEQMAMEKGDYDNFGPPVNSTKKT